MGRRWLRSIAYGRAGRRRGRHSWPASNRRPPLSCSDIRSGGSASASAGRSIRRRAALSAAIRSKAGTIFRCVIGFSERSASLPLLGNDCDVAGLAEARFGAGRGRRVVFYVTIGSGIGGGLVVDGQIYRGHGIAAAEIGHLRPGLHADRPDETVESLASGWGIAAAAQSRLADPIYHPFPSLREEGAGGSAR